MIRHRFTVYNARDGQVTQAWHLAPLWLARLAGRMPCGWKDRQ